MGSFAETGLSMPHPGTLWLDRRLRLWPRPSRLRLTGWRRLSLASIPRDSNGGARDARDALRHAQARSRIECWRIYPGCTQSKGCSVVRRQARKTLGGSGVNLGLRIESSFGAGRGGIFTLSGDIVTFWYGPQGI